jgi:MRC1-like domain
MKNSSTLTLSYRGKGLADTVCNREQEDEQDKEVERLHLAAIQGELRLKRNRGVGVDDSDEESDNEENERARRAMKRLRTTDRGDIKDLGAWYLSLFPYRC